MSSFLMASDPKFIFSIFDDCLGFHPSHLSFIVWELDFNLIGFSPYHSTHRPILLDNANGLGPYFLSHLLWENHYIGAESRGPRS